MDYFIRSRLYLTFLRKVGVQRLYDFHYLEYILDLDNQNTKHLLAYVFIFMLKVCRKRYFFIHH
jgi:hypothetical protein